MVKKLTVKDYANLLGISTVAVYKKIGNKVINSIKENNKTYVVIDEEELNTISKPSNKVKTITSLSSFESYLITENKYLKKQVKKLQKELTELHQKKEYLYLEYVSEMKKLYLPQVEIKKKNKSKKGG